MKRIAAEGLAALLPGFAVGGQVGSNDQYRKPAMLSGATFSGSPKGTGLEAPGQFTTASAQAFKGGQQTPAVSAGSAVQPRSVDDARRNSLSAFLGGDISSTAPAPITGTPVAKPAAALPVAPPTTSSATSGGAGGRSDASSLTVSKSSQPRIGGLSLVEAVPPASTAPLSVEALDRQQDTVKYGLPTGETVGYGGKLDYDVGRAYRNELGRDPDEAGRAYWRNRLAGGMGLADLESTFNDSAEGREYNLTADPLDDQQFLTRAYRTILGRDPDEAGMGWLGGRLAQGYDRQAVIDSLLGSDEFRSSGRARDDLAIDRLMSQGDSFDASLRGDDPESLVRSHFTAIMGREPSARELAKYAAALRAGTFTAAPGERSIIDAITARKAQGWARGGRIKVRRSVGGPLDEPEGMSKGGRVKGYAEGGRVTNRDRFIEEQVNGKPVTVAEKEVVVEKKPELGAAEKALLEKYRRKSLAEKVKAGLSALLD